MFLGFHVFLGSECIYPLERGYNSETPSNFPHHSSVMLIEWHAHLSYDWWRLPSGEAALASPLWQAPSNSSLDWASVGDNTRSRLRAQCVGLGHSVLGDNTRTRLMTSVSACGRVQGEGLCQGWQEAGAQAYEDLGQPRMSPGGRLMSRTTGSWDLGV